MTTAQALKAGVKFRGQVPRATKARTMPIQSYAPYRSRWEKEYADYLEFQKRGPWVSAWKYEAVTFRLADGAKFKPDFMVVEIDGSIRFDEVKGYERAAAILRWKVAAEMFPMFKWRMISKDKAGAWIVTRES